MTIKVYGLTTATARVVVTLYEKNVEDFEIVPVNLYKNEHKSPEFLKLQPFGQVPVFTDGDFTLFESRAISRMIAHKYEGQGTPLYGTTPQDKARVEQWIEVESQNFSGPLYIILYETVFAPRYGKATNEDVIAVQIAKIKTVLDVYEKHLSKSKYLAGDFFSLADLSHLPYLYPFVHSLNKGYVLESYPAVKAWFEEISSRPAWKKWVVIAKPADAC